MGQKTSSEVFVEAVEDHLNKTPHARHPVQFEPVDVPSAGLFACTLCRALVIHQDEHRTWHDNHVKVHDEILREASRYKSPPTYR